MAFRSTPSTDTDYYTMLTETTENSLPSYTTAPTVSLVSRPAVNWDEVGMFLSQEGYDPSWIDDRSSSSGGEILAEINGRICYQSFPRTNNKNITRMREDPGDYFANVLKAGHESILEHANYSFLFTNVSRVFTHELVRHRVGTAVSQESGRYVRTDHLDMAMPSITPEVNERIARLLDHIEEEYREIQGLLSWDEVDFTTKKEWTSALRRVLPEGRTTTIGWTANIRTLRHVIALRTAPGTEWEIQRVFDQVYQIMKEEVPLVFQDFETEAYEVGEEVRQWHRPKK